MTDRELFARLIKCEAEGEGLNGMRAVANVVMNRVHVAYGQYLRTGQGSLRRVIMEPGEFSCVLETIGGLPNPQIVWNAHPEEIHYEVADWALSGHKLAGIEECLWYYNPFSPQCATYFPRNKSGVIITRIVDHCFYNPTSYYAQT